MSSASASASASNFQTTIITIAVSQICQSIGFTTTQPSALSAFSHIATHFLQTLASLATSTANSSHRTQPNLLDIVYALEQLNSIKGFVGFTNLNSPILKSHVLKDIIRFVDSIDETPFAKPIPRKGFIGRRANFSVLKTPVFSHIPAWVPCFPDPSTYRTEKKRIGVLEPETDRGECSSSGGKNVNVEKEKEKEKEKGNKKKSLLPVKRPKVKFRFGLGLEGSAELGLGNGICRGGKRVSWRNYSEDADVKSSKRRR